jgi:glycosyltransferase involved in cell wall biosynthesis
MTVRAQYPIFGRSTRGFDLRAKWITAIHAEICKHIPTEFVRLFYVPFGLKAQWIYRAQMRLLERPGWVTHVTTNMHSFLLRPRMRCPTVITCYDVGLRWTTERLPLADRVIVSAQQVKAELEGIIRLPVEPEVVYLAVPPEYTPAEVPRKPSQVLYVGTEQPRKNVEGLFRILARVTKEVPVTLVKVGPASPQRARLEALARELGIETKIEWRDFVPEEELIHLYRSSTLAVVPSLLEGFSMTCLEAMSCGCPLVASSLSAVPEIVGSGGWLEDPRDEAAWADALLSLLKDPKAAADLSRRGIERARHFSAARSASQILRIYEEVATARKAR